MSHTIEVVQQGDELYPSQLAPLDGAPETLHYIGTLPTPETPLVAIVGTRKATRDGRELAKRVATELAVRGVTIVSGLALGIDAAAHDGALEAQGKTIAVLANGLDIIYPKTHQSLANKIIAMGGALISEYPAGTPPLPHRFLERNRIVSGLSLGTVFVEVPLRSGALVTAKHALDQGRELFVMPGPARHPNYKGSHLLLRNGARLVTSSDEILEDLASSSELFAKLSHKVQNTETNSSEEILILDTLKMSSRPVTVDYLIETTTLDAHIVLRLLAGLILKGIVQEVHGGYTIPKS